MLFLLVHWNQSSGDNGDNENNNAETSSSTCIPVSNSSSNTLSTSNTASLPLSSIKSQKGHVKSPSLSSTGRSPAADNSSASLRPDNCDLKARYSICPFASKSCSLSRNLPHSPGMPISCLSIVTKHYLPSSSSKPLGLSPLAPGAVNKAFPRGSANRSTFHSGQTRERRPLLNGPGGAPLQTQDTSSVSSQQRSSSFFSKLSSKFSKRCVAPSFDPNIYSVSLDRVVLPDGEGDKSDLVADSRSSRKEVLRSL